MKKYLFFLLFLVIFVFSLVSAEEKNIGVSFDVGSDLVGIETQTADFSFIGPSFGLTLDFNKKLRSSFNYISGEDSVLVGNSNLNFNWRQFNASIDYKILNEDKSIWASLLYRSFEIKTAWNDMSDKDNWNGLGIGLSYKPKLSENLYGSIGLNYFPTLSSEIGDYSNLEICGSLEYKFKNNDKVSLILHYTNQNLSSQSDNIGDIKVNQAGLKVKMKI